MFPYAEQVNAAGWYHLISFGVLIPILAIRGRRKFAGTSQPLPNRMKHFQSTATMLVLFTTLSLMVARVEWIQLFPRPTLTLQSLGAGLAMYIVAVLGMRPRWRRAVERRARIAYLFMPETRTERAWWVGVSALAGVGEEITWRGVQTALFAALTGSYLVAAVLTAISFGLGHIIQGWKSAAIIAVFSLGFQAIVWFTGSLYVAMAVHLAYDITAGLTYGRLGRELGYGPTPSPATESPQDPPR
jgi:membrane protease YdiL (CAAX protease family)